MVEGSPPELRDTFCCVFVAEDDSAGEGGSGVGGRRLVHQSEVVWQSINPSWRWDAGVIGEAVDWGCDTFVLQVWALPCARTQAGGSLLLEHTLELDSLVFVCSELRHAGEFGANTVLVEFEDGFYCLDDAASAMRARAQSTSGGSGVGGRASFNPTQLPATRGYTDKISRRRMWELAEGVLEKKREIRAVESEVKKRQATLLTQVERLKRAVTQAQARRQWARELAQLERDLEAKRERCGEERDALALQRERLEPRTLAIQEAPSVLQKHRTSLPALQANIEELQGALRGARAEAERYRWQLVTALYAIYPIHPSPGAPDALQICGTRLPNSLSFAGGNEELISTGLGYVCHLVFHLSKFLGVCLKYPLLPCLSHSSIMDEISTRATEFPLCMKGTEQLKFEYGVYLLNKDIEQILHSVDIKGAHVKNTLPNLNAIYALHCNRPSQEQRRERGDSRAGAAAVMAMPGGGSMPDPDEFDLPPVKQLVLD